MSNFVNGNLVAKLSIGQGDKGDKGEKGDAPVKGVDYFTQEDKEELILEILNRVTDGNEVAF